MKRFTNSRKFLFGVSVSMVLAMAIGSFALGESQTQASPRAVEAQNAVGATAGAFTVDGGTQGTDYEFTGATGTDGVLKIHPQSIETNITISNNGTTTDRIEVTSAATITLAGVDISTGTGAALQIQDNATFNVNILLEDGSNNILKTTKRDYAGLQKNGSSASIGMLAIGVPDGSQGTGKLETTGGSYGAGIGGRNSKSGSNITITGGEVTATGGQYATGIGGGSRGGGSKIYITGGVVKAKGGRNGAGIGSGDGQSGGLDGVDINISGGTVYATGGNAGAGIGGGLRRSGKRIIISGGIVEAIGGGGAAGIGGGNSGSGSNNSLNGDAVVLATSGNASRDALEGFVDDQGDSLLTQGITFTKSGTWNSAMYGNVTLSQNLEIPANLTVPAGQILSIKEGKDVTLSEKDGVKYTVEGELRNNGTVTLPEDLEVNDEGKVTTALIYDTQDGTITNADEYKTYQDSSEVKAYSELPNAEKEGYLLEGWYTEKNGEGTKVEETSLVLLNQHILYANWTANPEPSPEPEPIPDPSVDPDQGGDGSDASSKTGDSFAGIAALAILGLATTGAAILRKRKQV